MIKGSCLCGGVRFEIDRLAGPFELCHCSRCRKVTGSAFFAGIYIHRADFRLLAGKDLVHSFEAPILRAPPAYIVHFCGRCGSPVPDVFSNSERMEIAAGLLEDDPNLRPDKHIFTDVKSAWFEITDDLPQYDQAAIRQLRQAQKPSSDTPPR